MKIFIFILIMLITSTVIASVPINNQSFWCHTEDGGIWYLLTDRYNNCQMMNLSTTESHYGNYLFDGNKLEINVPDFDFFESSIFLEYGEGYIFEFQTKSLKCAGILN